MKRATTQRAKERREYNKQVGPFLAEHPWCQYPDCPRPSMVVHHSHGCIGWRLLYKPWWKASCWDHNQLAEDRTGEALACGWLVKDISGPLSNKPVDAA